MIRLPRWSVVLLALVLFLGLASPALAAEVKGKIKSINADKNEFVLTDSDDKDMTFQVDDEGKVRLNDKDSKLQDLKRGDEVTVVYEKKGDKLMAKEIRCKRE
jgi:hypothetical protein